jgi:hypothetical protein
MNFISFFLKTIGIEYKYGDFHSIKKANLYHKEIVEEKEANDLISRRVSDPDSLLVARIGSTELTLILGYMHFKYRRKVIWGDGIRELIQTLSGVFPTDDATLNKFAELYLDSISQVDIMGVWHNEGENIVIKTQCPQASLIPLRAIEPYFFTDPWSKHLSGRKVLVVHPFEESIRSQYANNREKLFENKNVLPVFDLSIVKAVQTLVYNNSPFANWFDALEYMKKAISNVDFDVAIIGAGAYGLPLAAYVKSLGKKAIHMGGATQILFGIKGRRWEEREEFRHFFNQYWTAPSDSERTNGAEKVDSACYW